jgi:hypothetical protein
MNPSRFNIAVRKFDVGGHTFSWELDPNPSGEPLLYDEETVLDEAMRLISEHGLENVKILQVRQLVFRFADEPGLL